MTELDKRLMGMAAEAKALFGNDFIKLRYRPSAEMRKLCGGGLSHW